MFQRHLDNKNDLLRSRFIQKQRNAKFKKIQAPALRMAHLVLLKASIVLLALGGRLLLEGGPHTVAALPVEMSDNILSSGRVGRGMDKGLALLEPLELLLLGLSPPF